MGFAKSTRKNSHVVHEKRHALAKLVSDITKLKLPPESSQELVKNIAKQLQNADPKIHRGAAVGIAYAITNFKKFEAEMKLKDKILTAFIFGGVARGLKTDRLPKDIDILIVRKNDVNLPKVKLHPRINLMVYTEGLFNEKHLRGNTPQASFDRTILALPILPLYGEEYLKRMIEIAIKNLKFSDINEFIESQVKKRRDQLWLKGEWIPPHDELKKEVIDYLEITDVIKELLLSKELDLRKNVFDYDQDSKSEESL